MGWSVPAAFFASLFFFFYQGLPYGLAGFFCGMTNRAGRGAGPFFAAGIFTLLIAIWPALCPGSPAVSLYSWPQAIQIADIGGMPLVLFFMLLANALLAEVITASPFKRRIRYAVLFIFLISVVLGYGSMRINQLETLEAAHPESRISVRTIQPNILSKSTSGSNNQIQLSNHPALRQITEESALNSTPVDLILWPEAPGSPSCDNLDLQALARTEALNQSPLLFSCTEYHYRVKKQEPVIGPDGSEITADTEFPLRELNTMHNSLALMTDGQIAGVYHKTRLVPFAEATPFSERWPLLQKSLGKRHEYKPGPGPDLLVLPGGLRLQPLICFESGFPDITRTGAAMGADAFVTVANDGWFVHQKAAELHLGLALFRAVEQRRPLIRATNTGMGAHIHATGEIEEGSRTPMDQVTYRQASLFVPDVQTIYLLIGNNWLWVLAVMLAVIQRCSNYCR